MRPDLNDPALRARAVAAARGDAPFDLLVTGGTLLDAVTGALRPADLGLVGPLIASVHAPGSRTDAAETLDARGRILVPGFIDAHMHVESSMVTPAEYARRVVPDGVTAICWDPHEFANVHGLHGVARAIAASRGLPLDVMVMAPSCVPSAPGLERAGATFGPEEMAEMLAWPETIGVAEVMDMRGVVEGDPRMTGIVAAGRASGKPVMGHARGLSGARLQAFVAAGISSDHEIVSAADLIEKLEAGLWIELRGSHDHLLPDCVAALKALPRIPQTLTICTDDVFPDDLHDKGGLTDVLRRLVRYGLDPIEAVRCATLNAALRLGRADLGLIAPGRRATFSLLTDLPSFAVDRVIVDGRLAAEGGALLGRPNTEPLALSPSMAVAPLAPADFVIAPIPGKRRVRLRTIKGARFTAWSAIELDVRDGALLLPAEVGMMAVIPRHGQAPAVPSLAALEDWGTWRGLRDDGRA